MEFKICDNCNMIFQYKGSGDVLCPDCTKKSEEDYEKVRAFMAENPGAREEDIAAKTGVSMKFIAKLVKDDKIVIRDTNTQGLTCKYCGISIQSGKYCADCKRKFALEPGAVKADGTGMRFLRR